MPRAFTDLIVTSTEQLTPGMVRVRLRAVDGAAFAEAFGSSTDTDRYVKLSLGSEAEPVLRTYTVAELDAADGTLAIDFVVHGDEGYAGPWAASAQPGDPLTVRGPGGGYAPSPEADWHLLVGDESAIPAIRAALVALPTGAVADVVIEVPGPEHEQPLPAPDGVTVTWVHRGNTTHSAYEDVAGVEPPLLAAVRTLPWREGRVHAFVHGEAEVVMHGIRPYLLLQRGVPRADASISGYWRRGRTEETFRQWKSELAAAESGTAGA